MSAHIDCEVRAARDPETGEVYELLSIPEGYIACLVPKETAERLAEWTECCAVRITTEGDTIASLEVTDDMDWLTSPEAA